MNLEQDKQFEDRLRELNPQQPDARLCAGILTDLRIRTRQQRLARLRVWLGWSGLGVAASLLITFGILLFNGQLDFPAGTRATTAEEGVTTDATPMVVDEFEPVLAENNLKGRIDEGIVFLGNGFTARRYRYEFVDRVVWKNPADGSIIEMEIPRDEVILVPVQTF